MAIGEIKAAVWTYMTGQQIGRISDYQKRYKLPNRSAAINHIIDLGLAFEKRIGEVESWTPEIVKELKRQIDIGTLVDFVSEIPDEKFRIINDIVKTEYGARAKRK